MNLQELQADKLSLIRWISKLQDVSTISKLKSFQEESDVIPQWQKDLIDQRLYLIESGNEIFHDFEETIKEIEDEL
ncbi:MAG: hypothetical protein K9H64_02225 [Bacteroidales bacterium]|nr:hypothetical protein [Bacteroidales bacterium]MCF8454636.1 hypothetical protein [Bacteroidales bacterium]